MPLSPGGSDAGATLLPYYAIAESHFPILADTAQILPDTAVGTFGLAWYRGLDTKGTTDPADDEPRFAVRDDIDVDAIPYVGLHEAGHAFQETVARYMAQQQGVSWLVTFNQIRERYWAFRGFPGSWYEAQLSAIVEQRWDLYPDESFADCFAHAMLFLSPVPGYVTGEWTWNYNTQPIWQKAADAVNFMRQLASEAEGEVVDAETKQAILETRDILKALAKVSLPAWLDRLGDGRDVTSGLTDKTATKP